ncbi:hypothetical protein IWW55_000845 [Coemansia sp. RSA 2706]|nr:hypothetical protein IWW55_000845 [Coemansia sp. RSA 2706]
MCTKHPTPRLFVRSVFQCNDCNYTSEEESDKVAHEEKYSHYDWTYMHYFS